MRSTKEGGGYPISWVNDYRAGGPVNVMLLFFLLVTAPYGESSEEVRIVEPLSLTVSSLSRETVYSVVPIDREIQIHFTQPFDRIAVHDSNPQNEFKEPVYVVGAEQLIGKYYVQTNFSLGNPEFPQGWALSSQDAGVPGDHCLPVWAVGYRNKEVTYTDCIKIRPTWMQDNKLFIANLDVRNLMIPGTHNSGCYKKGEKLSLRDTIGRYILTQDQSIWNQLVYGIRYLDFRVGYYAPKGNSSLTDGNESRFWLNHDLIKVRPLAPVVAQIKKFLEKATHEVIIIDFHRFPIGFNMRRERHDALVSYLERELKDYAIPYTKQPLKLDQIWDTSKRLILAYGEHSIAKEKDWLWPPIKQVWGNKDSPGDLEEFIEKTLKNSTNFHGLWAVMAQLTPGPLELILNPKGSLREMAHKVNPSLLKWSQKSSWWSRLKIVATDFFLETGIIDLAVQANVHRGHKSHKYSDVGNDE